MYSWLVNLTLLVVLFISSTVSQSNRTCMGPFLETPGYTIPSGNIVLPLGTPLEIFCTLNIYNAVAKNHTADDLIFRKGDETIDKKYVSVVNETTARLYMENLRITEDIKYYYCYLVLRDHTKVPSRVTAQDRLKPHPLMVCMNHVEIGIRPQNVDNFTCVSHNLEILNCTWRELNNGIFTKYLVYYSTGGRDKWYSCPVYKKGTCQWTSQTDPPYLTDANDIHFRINGFNKIGNSTQMMKFDHRLNMIPDRPSGAVAMSSTSHSVHLQWSIGNLKNFVKGLVYKVNYTWYLPKYWRDKTDFESFENPYIQNLTLDWKVRLYNAKDVEQNDDEIQVNVTGLPYPNVGYQFKIEMKSAASESDSWSEPAFVNVKTDPCPPYRSPETDFGSFTVFNEFEDRRDVLVYWKAIPEEEYNGDKFRYKIVAFKDNVHLNILPDSVNSSFAKYTNLTLNSYEFVITSVNLVGSAPYSTSVRLPNQKDILPELSSFTKIEYDDGRYQLLWQPSKSYVNVKITNMTIYNCENNQSYPAPCSSSLYWEHLPATAVNQNFTLKPNTTYQFALSVNSVNSTSGMFWARCTIYRNRRTSLNNVWIDEVGSHFIEIRWTLECSERNPDIRGYNVTYCPINERNSKTCTKPHKKFLVYGDVNTNHVNVTGLQPLTPYKLTVASFTNKLIGFSSKEMHTRTLQSTPDMVDVEVQVLNITNSSAVVKWNKPAKLNGILDHYEVSYDNKTLITNDTTAILTELRSYEEYQAIVSACTTVCSPTNPVLFHTAVGDPGELTVFRHEKDSNGRMVLKWKPPMEPGGPNPFYEVRITLEKSSGSTFDEFEISETETFAEAPCERDNSHSTLVFYIRAKNMDDSDPNNIKYYFGPWSEAYTINCSTQTMRKIVIGSSVFLLFFALIVFFGKKAYRKYLKMRDVQIVLPTAFVTRIQNEIRDASENQKLSMDRNKVDNDMDEVFEDDLISVRNIYLNPCYDKESIISDTKCNMG